jgi:ribulose kinase
MKNPYWLSENADATAYEIHLAEKEEAVTLGAVLLGAVACGAFSTLPGAAVTVWTKPGSRAFHDAGVERNRAVLVHFAMKRKREDEPRTARQISFLLRNEFIYRG